jgi:DNA primase
MVTYTGVHIFKDTNKNIIPYKHAERSKSIIEVKHMLYNIDSCKDSCIIVEGVFDVWRIGNGAIGLMGTQFTLEQLELLINYRFKKVIVAFDEGAETAGYKLARQLSGIVPSVIHIEILRGDPDTLPEEEINYIRSLL